MRHHLGDDLVPVGNQVPLRRAQLGVPHHGLHVGQRQIPVRGHPPGRRVSCPRTPRVRTGSCAAEVRCAGCGAAPPTSRLSAIATRRPAAGLDFGASATPVGQHQGQARGLPSPDAQRTSARTRPQSKETT